MPPLVVLACLLSVASAAPGGGLAPGGAAPGGFGPGAGVFGRRAMFVAVVVVSGFAPVVSPLPELVDGHYHTPWPNGDGNDPFWEKWQYRHQPPTSITIDTMDRSN